MTRPYEYTNGEGGKVKVVAFADSNEASVIMVKKGDVAASTHLPTGPKLTEFLQAVADGKYVVIPVADLPEVNTWTDDGGKTWLESPEYVFDADDRAAVLRDISHQVAIVRAMDAHEAGQGDEDEAKVEELADRFLSVNGLLADPEALAREAIAWHEEQGR